MARTKAALVALTSLGWLSAAGAFAVPPAHGPRNCLKDRCASARVVSRSTRMMAAAGDGLGKDEAKKAKREVGIHGR